MIFSILEIFRFFLLSLVSDVSCVKVSKETSKSSAKHIRLPVLGLDTPLSHFDTERFQFVEFVPLCRNDRVQFLEYDISFYYIPFYNISIGGCDYLKNGEKMADKYLMETRMLDFSNLGIQELIHNLKWKEMDEFERVKAIYNYVRDDIVFGYNIDDEIPASKVLADGYGQCNTKGTLFMALLRACGIPCRIHGFTIDKKLQKGAMTGIVYRNAPRNVVHSWVEIYLEKQWYELEAFILDKTYLKKLQEQNPECCGTFCGYGVATKDFRNPTIEFDRNNTYIQSEGINQDFGVYDCPDDFFKEHHQEISGLKAFAYRHIGRHLMNHNIRKIREM